MVSKSLVLTVNAKGESHQLTFEAERLVCCGWAGRDRKAVEAHIDELARKYTGHDYTNPIGPQGRVILEVTADKVNTSGR